MMIHHSALHGSTNDLERGCEDAGGGKDTHTLVLYVIQLPQRAPRLLVPTAILGLTCVGAPKRYQMYTDFTAEQ